MQIISKSADQTRIIAKNMITNETDFSRPIIFLLYGDLGSGKTTFTKGVGEYFGVKKIISPSFIVNCEYEVLNRGVKKLIHFDFYNLKDSEYDLIGLDEALIPGNVVVIEWPENNESLVKRISRLGKIIKINFEHISENERRMTT